MKTLKTLAFWFSFFMLTPFLASCDDDDNGGSDKDRDNGNDSELIGTWYTADMTESITFRRDSTFTWDNSYRPYSGDFRYDEDRNLLTLTRDFVIDEDKEPEVENFRVSIKNGKLTLTNLVNGYEYYFYKDGEYTDDNDEEDDNQPNYGKDILVGTWEVYDYTDPFKITFFQDNTCYIEGDGTGTYRYDEATRILSITIDGGTIVFYIQTITDDYIIMQYYDDPEEQWELNKISNY